MKTVRAFLNCISSKQAFVLAIILFYIMPTPVNSHDGAQAQESNNDRIMAIQKYGGVREDTGELSLTFYGNMAFKIISPRGVELFIDPWRNDDSGMYPYWYQMQMPITRADLGLVTHAHYDHDAIGRLDAAMTMERMAGTFTLGDVNVIGIAEKHVCETQSIYGYREPITAYLGRDPCPPHDTMQWNNSLYVIEVGGLRILHWGDNRQNPPDHIWEMIGDIDIAILAISDEGHILTHEWADRVVERLNPNIIIPSHYYVKGINIPNVFGLQSAENWVKKYKHTNLDSHTLSLTAEKVGALKQHVIYFGDHVPFEVAGKAPPAPEKSDPPAVPEPARAWQRYAPTKEN